MIHTTTQKAKFKLLCRHVRALLPPLPIDVETIVVGLLERLWHCTATSSPSGDIGKLPDELIAEMVGWQGDPAAMIEALVSTRWLDRCDEYRLLVHDWHDHAPNYIKGNIGKLGGFVTESGVTLGIPPRDAPRDTPDGVGLKDTPSKPNQTKPNQTQQNQNLPSPSASGLFVQPEEKAEPKPKPPRKENRPSESFNRFWAAYPRKIAKGDAEKAFAKLNPDDSLLQKILESLAWQLTTPDWRKEDGQFIPYPASWLNAKRWEDSRTVNRPAEPPRVRDRLDL